MDRNAGGTHQYLGSHDYNPGGLVTEAPVFDPPAGTYLAPVDVTITSATAGAAIRYTTDGTDPTPTTGTLYSGEIHSFATTHDQSYRL
jgi:hypothetical protein